VRPCIAESAREAATFRLYPLPRAYQVRCLARFDPKRPTLKNERRTANCAGEVHSTIPGSMPQRCQPQVPGTSLGTSSSVRSTRTEQQELIDDVRANEGCGRAACVRSQTSEKRIFANSQIGVVTRRHHSGRSRAFAFYDGKNACSREVHSQLIRCDQHGHLSLPA